MSEFFKLCLSLPVLPFTVLLILNVIYWLGVILGALDISLFDFDMDADMDQPGIGVSLLNLLNLGEVPFMVVISVMVLSLWCISMIANDYANANGSLLLAALLLIPNFIVSVLITAIVTRPLRKLFTLLGEDEIHEKILSKVGTITTSTVTPTFGQMEIQTKGAPVIINVRTTGESQLVKGDQALVYDEDKDKGVYFVEKFEA